MILIKTNEFLQTDLLRKQCYLITTSITSVQRSYLSCNGTFIKTSISSTHNLQHSNSKKINVTHYSNQSHT